MKDSKPLLYLTNTFFDVLLRNVYKEQATLRKNVQAIVLICSFLCTKILPQSDETKLLLDTGGRYNA